MSRLSDLLVRLDAAAPELAADLRFEVDSLESRRAFGLNFERHTPETVELPGRPVRKGDKVRVLPARGSGRALSDRELWRVVGFQRNGGGEREAVLESLQDGSDGSAALADLVVVAEFRDPIYPGLVSTGKVERGGDLPYHTVINAENYHALELLRFTHRGKIDAIYIDPPYNTGDKSWKYNNAYVEGDDLYRHSKWLAMMERRLLLAKDLLNPADSVLIVTIDEKEYLRLGLLLEQVFPDALIQMVTVVINPLGQERLQQLARVDEYIYYVFFGKAQPATLKDDLLNVRSSASEASGGVASAREASPNDKVRWEWLLRGGGNTSRQRRPNLFYPVFVDQRTRQVAKIGEPLPLGVDRSLIDSPKGTVAVWPVKTNGTEGEWRVAREYLQRLLLDGYARVGAYDRSNDRWSLLYLGKAQIDRIQTGELEITGRREDGSVTLTKSEEREQRFSIKTVWNRPHHRSGEYGTKIITTLLPGRRFPFPKALYLVEDTLRTVVANKPNAVILDFFAGSGTTAHAVMRLNRQDGGQRQAILVTNNEVSADETRELARQGLRPGDEEWEARGICEWITKPRITAAITGLTPSGEPIGGTYKFTDEFPMADGFAANAEFFTMTYEAPLKVASDREFARIAPILWLRAGARGRRIKSVESGWDVAETYGVIVDLDQSASFAGAVSEAVANHETKNHGFVAFIVTDEDRLFEQVVQELPADVEKIRLYEAYLRNFEVVGRSA